MQATPSIPVCGVWEGERIVQLESNDTPLSSSRVALLSGKKEQSLWRKAEATNQNHDTSSKLRSISLQITMSIISLLASMVAILGGGIDVVEVWFKVPADQQWLSSAYVPTNASYTQLVNAMTDTAKRAKSVKFPSALVTVAKLRRTREEIRDGGSFYTGLRQHDAIESRNDGDRSVF